MADAPDLIVLKRDRDLVGRRHEIWVRRSLLGLLVAVPLLALFNVFGQRPHDSTVQARYATLALRAPSRLRSGLIYEARFEVRARRPIRNAVLVLDRAWFEGMTLNTIEPSPQGEDIRDGEPVFELGPVAAGKSRVLFVQVQVNPTTAGRRSQTVQLLDGTRLLATIHRKVTVFP
jgi:hypothetical protein